MPKPDCSMKQKKAALIVKTLTADNKGKVCNIGAHQDIRHYVRLMNFIAYQTDIECTARIITDASLIRFNSHHPGVTDEEWQDKCTLYDRGDHTFSHVRVLSTPPYDEKHEIRVDLKIERWQRGERDSASLSITVWS